MLVFVDRKTMPIILLQRSIVWNKTIRRYGLSTIANGGKSMMSTRKSHYWIVTIALIVLLLYMPSSYATNGMKVIGVGAVQRSMGGASVGLPLNSATTITNPAGITELEKRLDFGLTYFAPDVNYQASSNAMQVTYNNTTLASDMKYFFIPALGVVKPIDERFSVGLGAYGVSGMGVDYEENLYNNITYTNYALMKIAPTVAYSVNDRLSIGIAPNIDYATMEFEAGMPTEVAHHEGSAFGFGFTVGLLYRANDLLSFGCAYESRQWFSDFEFDTVRGTDKLSFDQPQSVTFGVGITPTERFRLAFDVMWIDWASTMGRNRPGYSVNSSNATSWNMYWDEQLVYKIGAEFDINEKISLRAGYNYGRNPLKIDRTFENISFPAITEHHITCGAGLDISENMELNLGFMYAPEVTLNTSNAGQFINSATTRMAQYSVDVAIAYKF